MNLMGESPAAQAGQLPQTFVGWHRARRGHWQRVCEGITEREAWTKLLDRVQGGEKIVLVAGRHPNDKPG